MNNTMDEKFFSEASLEKKITMLESVLRDMRLEYYALNKNDEYDIQAKLGLIKSNAEDSLLLASMIYTAVMQTVIDAKSKANESTSDVTPKSSDQPSLGEFLEDDPEGFMDDWDEYKRTPVIPIDKDAFENCKTCEHTPEECDKCYPELGYKNTKLERDTKAVTDNAEELASLVKNHERKR